MGKSTVVTIGLDRSEISLDRASRFAQERRSRRLTGIRPSGTIEPWKPAPAAGQPVRVTASFGTRAQLHRSGSGEGESASWAEGTESPSGLVPCVAGVFVRAVCALAQLAQPSCWEESAVFLPVQNAVVKLMADALDDTTAGNHAGLWVDTFFGLFIDWPGYSPALQLSDLTVATFTGYVRKASVFGAQFVSTDGKIATLSDQVSWVPTDGVTPNVVLGAFLATAVTGGLLLGVEQFPTPREMKDATSMLAYTCQAEFDPAWVFGFGSVNS
jgi:hypothetical protein